MSINHNRLGRRALVGAAAAAVCAAAAGTGVAFESSADQKTLQSLRQANQIAVNKAYTDGMAAGRQAVIDQLKQINGIQLQSAITSAHNTRAATKVIAQPAANMLATITGDALSTLISLISDAQTLMSFISGAYKVLGLLKDFFQVCRARSLILACQWTSSPPLRPRTPLVSSKG